MDEIQVFSNKNFSIRTVNANGEIWFVARDVAQALDYSESSNPSRLFYTVPEIWKGMKRIHTLGGEQEMLCLTEQGLYFFLGRSDKQKALPYQMWIAGDVVPSIKHTGGYGSKSLSVANEILPAAKIIFEAAGITGNQLSLALDKTAKHYIGVSILEISGMTKNADKFLHF